MKPSKTGQKIAGDDMGHQRQRQTVANDNGGRLQRWHQTVAVTATDGRGRPGHQNNGERWPMLTEDGRILFFYFLIFNFFLIFMCNYSQ